MIKTELHAHTADDPHDLIPYSTAALVDHAAALGYGAIAVTLHDDVCPIDATVEYARGRGVVLLSGIERTIEGKHVLLINGPARALLAVRTFADLAALRADHPAVLVVAPHPFYPVSTAMGSRLLERHRDLVDAIEYSGLYTRELDFNRRAVAWARRQGKPVVGNSDLHRLQQLGSTYSLVDAPADADAICAAIRAGRVELRTHPLTWPHAARFCSEMIMSGVRRRWQRRLSDPVVHGADGSPASTDAGPASS